MEKVIHQPAEQCACENTGDKFKPQTQPRGMTMSLCALMRLALGGALRGFELFVKRFQVVRYGRLSILADPVVSSKPVTPLSSPAHPDRRAQSIRATDSSQAQVRTCNILLLLRNLRY